MKHLLWNKIIRQINHLPFKENIEVMKRRVSHPLRVGFKEHFGMPKGQIADYRKRMPNGQCVHVLEYRDKYYIHRDRIDPRKDPLGHAFYDMKNIWGGALSFAIALFAVRWYLKQNKS